MKIIFDRYLNIIVIKKAVQLCTAPKKLDTIWGYFYALRFSVRKWLLLEVSLPYKHKKNNYEKTNCFIYNVFILTRN